MWLATADHKWGQAYLTREFFHRIGETMGKNVLLVVAREGPGTDGDVVAGALNLVGSHALFGRNWGCHPAVYVKHLHFETCYYQVRIAQCEPSAVVHRTSKLAQRSGDSTTCGIIVGFNA